MYLPVSMLQINSRTAQKYKSDEPYLQTHWVWDIGTKSLARNWLVEHNLFRYGSFFRLICDANRHRDRADLILPMIEGYELSFNNI